jgi:heme-degrading monooxygenase HmoA
MHVQIVNFQLNGINEAQYREVCDEVAPAFAAVPGLVSKVWLADQPTNTYGGVYLWRDRQAMQDYLDSELFRGVSADPHLKDLTSRDFGVLEAPTEVTRGLALART